MLEPWHYIALLGAVVAVWALSMPRHKTVNPPVQSVQNMETALEQFMENMEKDNEDLLQLVAKAQAEAKEEGKSKDGRIAALEQRCEALDLQLRETMSQLARTAITPSDPGSHAEEGQAESRAATVKMTDTAPSEATVSGDSLSVANSAYEQPQSIASRYPELFRLYEQGKSIEAIAKKLGLNKGEVQLIIGLAKQEGAAHV